MFTDDQLKQLQPLNKNESIIPNRDIERLMEVAKKIKLEGISNDEKIELLIKLEPVTKMSSEEVAERIKEMLKKVKFD